MDRAKIRSRLRTILVWGAIGAAVYFGNVEVQTWLGRRALEKSGLEIETLSEALRQAERDERLVLADLSAIWCSTCRRLDTEVLSNPRVREVIRTSYVFARIEYESQEGERFRERYGVRGFPTLLVLDAQGHALRRLPVVFDPDRFLELLRPPATPPSHAAVSGSD